MGDTSNNTIATKAITAIAAFKILFILFLINLTTVENIKAVTAILTPAKAFFTSVICKTWSNTVAIKVIIIILGLIKPNVAIIPPQIPAWL